MANRLARTILLRMGLFGKGQVAAPLSTSLEARVSVLEAELLKTQSAVRTLETEQLNMHDQVRRWMRRAVAAERSVERAEGHAAPATPAASVVPVLGTIPATGARARRLARALAERMQPGAASGENNGGD